MAVDKDQNLGRLSSSFDRVANEFWQKYEDPDESVHKSIQKTHLLELLQEYDQPKILDAGGGSGNWSITLAKLGYDVTLLDISPVSLSIAKDNAQRLGAVFKVEAGNIEKTSYDNESFDVVLAMGGVINYTPHPREMLGELNRIVRHGGFVWIDHYNPLGWAIQLKAPELISDTEGWLFNPDMKYPERTFACAYIEELIVGLGLQVIRKIGYGLNDLSAPEAATKEEIQDLKTIALAVSRDESCAGACGCRIIVARK